MGNNIVPVIDNTSNAAEYVINHPYWFNIRNFILIYVKEKNVHGFIKNMASQVGRNKRISGL